MFIVWKQSNLLITIHKKLMQPESNISVLK